MEAEALLHTYFGHTSFREPQKKVIDHLLAGRDVLAILPTGAGKSICYQIPALMMEGVTLVISPLISLMRDQVTALIQNGIPAAYLNSTLTPRQYAEALRRAQQGAYRILYVAPERLMTESFLRFVSTVRVSMIAVDEAHCISQWGQDFRPSYLEIPRFMAQLANRPVVSAFTATATERVRKDILHSLNLKHPQVIVTGFDRENLYFAVQHPDSKDGALVELIRQHRGESGIVYCLTRRTVEQVCELLCHHGVRATRYHGGLQPEERRQNQEDFLYDRKTVMVATNAFGMGIDKSNVSFVIHYNMPRDLESYYQEAGRAGRDGSPADCILLYSQKDVRLNRFLINRIGEENDTLTPAEVHQLQQRDLERLQHMVNYCKSRTCLRRTLLGYFGEVLVQPCENCSNCLPNCVDEDWTVAGQKLLSCVCRVMRSGYQPGKSLVYEILQGKETEPVTLLGLGQLSTFGLMKETTTQELEELTEHLEAYGFLTVTKGFCPLLHPTERANLLLKGKKRLIIHRPAPQTVQAAEKQATENTTLFQELKALRLQLAKKSSVPAFVICSDATLRDLCRKRPTTMKALLNVSGIGNVKAKRYGADFLKAICKHL